MIKILIISLLILASVTYIASGIKVILTALKKIEEERKHRNKMKKWPKVKARIVELGYGLDYHYPGKTLDTSDIKGSLAKEAAQVEYDAENQRKIQNRVLYGDVLIRYSYRYGDEDWITRSIGPFPGEKDLSILYKLKKGSIVKAYVNPEDPAESYLRTYTDTEMNEIANDAILSKIHYFAIGLILFALSAIAFNFNITI